MRKMRGGQTTTGKPTITGGITATTGGATITLTAPFASFSTANNAFTSSDPRVSAMTTVQGAIIKTTSPLTLKHITVTHSLITGTRLIAGTSATGINVKGATGGFVRLSDWPKALLGANVKLSSSTPATIFPLTLNGLNAANLDVLGGQNPMITITLTVA